MTDSRSRVSSRETGRLARVRVSPIPAHTMGPPRFACSEHKELLRSVHGGWDCGHWRDFIEEGQKVTQPDEQAVLAIPKATLLSSGLVFDSDYLYTLDYFQAPAKLPDSVSAADRFEALLSVIWRSPPDYNHFVTETLPRLLFCRDLIREYGASIRIPWYYDLATPYVRQYLALLNLEDLPFLTTTYDPVEAFVAGLVLLPFCYPRDPRTVAHDDPVAWYPLVRDLRGLRSEVFDRAGAHADLGESGRRTVIYASRRDVAGAQGGAHAGSGGGGRAVINEDEILSLLLERYGPELVLFVGGQFDIRSTIRLFANARMVIGPHGGAFVNTLFCPAGAHLVEFLPSLQPTQYFYRTSACLEQSYWPLPIRGCRHEDALHIPPAELLRILDAIDSQ